MTYIVVMLIFNLFTHFVKNEVLSVLPLARTQTSATQKAQGHTKAQSQTC